jgi:hypothetical protein
MSTLLREWDLLGECYDSSGSDLFGALQIGEKMIDECLSPRKEGLHKPGSARWSFHQHHDCHLKLVPAPPGKIVEISLKEVDDLS